MRISGTLIGVALGLLSSGVPAAEATCLRLPQSRIALQLYSVIRELQPPPEPGAPRPGLGSTLTVDAGRLDALLGELHDIGWRNIETVGGNLGIGDAGLKSALETHQLQVVAAHESLNQPGWESVLDRARLLGQTFVGSSVFGTPGLDTLDNVLATAANLNKLGEAAHARGLKFYIHSHRDEFTHQFSYDVKGNGHPQLVTAWEIVAARTDPRYVSFEIDIHWARLAMGVDRFDDLLKFLRAHRSRVALLHFKDTAADGRIADLGRGTTDWRRVLAAAGPQVQFYIWEFDNPPQPLASAKIAYNYMTCDSR